MYQLKFQILYTHKKTITKFWFFLLITLQNKELVKMANKETFFSISKNRKEKYLYSC